MKKKLKKIISRIKIRFRIIILDMSPLDYEFHYYGASKNLVNYLKTKLPCERVCEKINWPHGWVPNHETQSNSVGRVLLAFHSREKPFFNFVATREQENLIASFGYQNTKAIGHPFIYTKEVLNRRKAKSLLVMPIHSSSGEEFNGISFQKYVEEIEFIKNKFDSVDIVIHPNDIRQGYWVNEFNKKGFKVITGFEAKDMSSGNKMRSLFGQYEFMSTNGFGSHIVFASYCGVKVSVYGTFAVNILSDNHDYVLKYNEHYKNDHYFFNDEKVIYRSEKDMQINFPFLFVQPWQAKVNENWAREQLGESCRIDKHEFIKIINKIKSLIC